MRRLRGLLFLLALVATPSLADSYDKQLGDHLNKFKEYPASAKERAVSGEAIVSFEIDRDGKLVSSNLARGSGHADLDEAALAMLVRAQPLPVPPDMTGTTQKFTLPVLFRSKLELKPSDPDTDLSAFMTGKCRVLKIAGRDFTCRAVSYFHTKQGRARFTIVLDDPLDDGHVVAFSGENGRKTHENRYELPIDRILLNSKDRPRINGIVQPTVEPSAGVCKQIGNFSARSVSSISCTAMDRGGRQYQLEFESDGSPIVVKGQKDERISGSSPALSQTTTTPNNNASLPAVIRAATLEVMKDCPAKEIPETAITITDLNGDGVKDYIVNFDAIFENVSGCSCGTAGCPYDFWVSANGTFVKSFSQRIQSISRIGNSSLGRTVTFDTHGSACNQVGSTPCHFMLRWDGSKAKVERLASNIQNQAVAVSDRPSHLGKWYVSDPAVCNNDPNDLNLGLLVYSTKEVWGPDETGCQIRKSTSRGGKIDLTMQCSTEGTTNTALDHETLEVIGDKLKRTIREGRKQRTSILNRCPETVRADTLSFGSKSGMSVTVISKVGINTDHAVIKTKYTRKDAMVFCEDYVGKRTEKCVRETLATPIAKEVTGNCVTGRFKNFYNEDHQFLGEMKSKGDDTMAEYIIKNIATGQIADGSNGSGYPTNLGIFEALCPNKVRK